MKDIKLTITAGVDSHMYGYDLVMITQSDFDEKKITRTPFKGKGLRKFYKKSNSYMSITWTKKVNFKQYLKVFPRNLQEIRGA